MRAPYFLTIWYGARHAARYAAGRAPAAASAPWRERFAAPLLGAGAVALSASRLLLSARILELRITLTDSSAPAVNDHPKVTQIDHLKLPPRVCA
jgi:hypothetical protein